MAKKEPKLDSNDIIDKVSNLIKFASENKLSELELDTAAFGLKIKKHSQLVSMPINMPLNMPVYSDIQQTKKIPSKAESAKKGYCDSNKTIYTPLAGIFYRAKSPTSAPLAKEGDYVTPGTVLGLVSACKNLNEIISDKSGKIAKFISANEANVSKGDPIVVLE